MSMRDKLEPLSRTYWDAACTLLRIGLILVGLGTGVLFVLEIYKIFWVK